jgi:hypothetical protein
MRELSALRKGWDDIRLIETRLKQGMSIQDSLEQWLVLQHTFEPQLQETAPIFTSQRRQALVELQERLQRLADWHAMHGRSFPIGSKDTKPA